MHTSDLFINLKSFDLEQTTPCMIHMLGIPMYLFIDPECKVMISDLWATQLYEYTRIQNIPV